MSVYIIALPSQAFEWKLHIYVVLHIRNTVARADVVVGGVDVRLVGYPRYLQMEYFSHGSLKQWVAATAPDIATRRCVLRQVLLAISYIHAQGRAHCDLKGENVLIAADGTPRLCDFEMSRNLESASVSASQFGGTLGFIAPEVISKRAKPSQVSDMFAFGVLMLNTIHPPADLTKYHLAQHTSAHPSSSYVDV